MIFYTNLLLNVAVNSKNIYFEIKAENAGVSADTANEQLILP